MSFRIGGITVIRTMGDAKCEECGKLDELRPYGLGGKAICYECARKIWDIVEYNMGVQLFGDKGELK